MDINNLRECKGDLRGKKWNEIDSYDWTIKKNKKLVANKCTEEGSNHRRRMNETVRRRIKGSNFKMIYIRLKQR